MLFSHAESAEFYETCRTHILRRFALPTVLRFQREINAMAYLHFDNVVQLHNLLWDQDNF